MFRRSIGRSGCKSNLVLVYYLLVIAPRVSGRGTTGEELKTLYEMCVTDGIELFLGVQLKWTHDSDGRLASVNMGQPFYVESVLRRFGL